MKIRGLGMLLVFGGVTMGALPAFAPTTPLTVQNQSQVTTKFPVFQKTPGLVTQPSAAPAKSNLAVHNNSAKHAELTVNQNPGKTPNEAAGKHP